MSSSLHIIITMKHVFICFIYAINLQLFRTVVVMILMGCAYYFNLNRRNKKQNFVVSNKVQNQQNLVWQNTKKPFLRSTPSAGAAFTLIFAIEKGNKLFCFRFLNVCCGFRKSQIDFIDYCLRIIFNKG